MEWVFPLNNGGEIKGLNDTGIEIFRGDPLRFLAREICQNSLDAGLEDKTVHIEFSSFSLKRANFPGITSLAEAFEMARDFWDMQSLKRTVQFFEKAMCDVSEETIPFLRISDYNTEGLHGSDGEFNTPWLNLTKSSGVSDKAGTAGGSFGIGKFAPYACSSLQTVFYGTIDSIGKRAFQGVSRITSFQRRNTKDITTNVGYWGATDNKPAKSYPMLDASFERDVDQSGTDIFIAGFRFHDQSDWKENILGSILDGFLYAIDSKKLSIQIDDIVVNHETLPSLLEDYGSFSREHAPNYYEVLHSPNTEWFEEENFKNLGMLRLGLIIQPDLHRRVAMIRKTGMKIMDRGGISGIIPFAGILLVEGHGINEYLRKLENPSHTAWEPERMEPHSRINQARTYLRDLVQFIKDSLEKLKQSDQSDQIDADVGEFLPDEYQDDDSNQHANIENISTTTRSISKRKVSHMPRTGSRLGGVNPGDMPDKDGDVDKEANIAGAGHQGGKNRAGRQGAGFEEGVGKGSNIGIERLSLATVPLTKIRSICLNREEGRYYLAFVPAISASNGQVDLYISAEVDRYRAKILGAKVVDQPDAEFKDYQILGLELKKDELVRVQLTLDSVDYLAMEVRAYGIKK